MCLCILSRSVCAPEASVQSRPRRITLDSKRASNTAAKAAVVRYDGIVGDGGVVGIGMGLALANAVAVVCVAV